MAERLTPQQEQAVYDRGGNLLVSAAAGSGKTKVLVDRLLSYLTDSHNPAELDEFLIITYTKAAAAELRGKIAAKLTQRIAEEPENRHLQRQMQRLYLTKISTVHAFCADILREYAYAVDLPGDFRVADENECRQLRESVMAELLNTAYENVDEDPDFRAFVDTQGLGRDDRLVPEILLKVYDSARCHLLPDQWLDACVRNTQSDAFTDVSQTLWGKYLIEDLQRYLDLQLGALDQCVQQALGTDGMEKPTALLQDTLFQLQRIRKCETWDEIYKLKSVDYGTLRFSKKCGDPELSEKIKAVRNACKKGMERKLKSFTDPSALLLADMDGTAAAVRGIVRLVREFDRLYDRAKRSRRILDFGDLEHKTLDILLGKHRTGPTSVSSEIARRFREIMVDEYQDSNGVQDAIFSALTRERHNCFMVGDVKQSIYQFRLADPGIFLEKYGEYALAQDAAPGQGRKVLLTSNFRSGGAVLAAANDVFRTCMSEKVGGLIYGDAEALREGIPHEPLGEPEVELLAIPVHHSQYEEEAALVARRIETLLDGSHFYRGSEGLAPIRPEDIAILLRSPGSSGKYYQEALEKLGIRCSSGGGEDLLQTQEISTLRAILQTISNPRQDIPLIAALTSPVFGFTADDLAAFRAKQRWGSVYDALAQETSEKAMTFLTQLEGLRKKARMDPLVQLIETIFITTHLDSIYAAMPDGQTKQANLQTFYQIAAEYERSGRKDLEQFLEYLQAMEEKGLVAAGENTPAGSVTIMSIHKSKGLEFPVVFVCGLSKVFNRESSRAQVLCDRDLGIGLTAVDTRNRVRYPTVAKRAIALKTVTDGLSEEMRVLYVALTRARDRLIMTYASGTLENDLRDLALRMDIGDRELLTADVTCPGEWVLMSALRRMEAGELFALSGRPASVTPGEPAWRIRVQEAPEPAALQKKNGDESCHMPAAERELIRKGLSFAYPHALATRIPSKQTATQRKGREKDAEAAEHTTEPKPYHRSWRRPSFAEASPAGTDRGNAIHAALQYIQFTKCRDLKGITEEIARLVRENFLTSEQADLVDTEQLAAFFQTELGSRLAKGGEVLREFKFSVLDDGENYDSRLRGEKILLQGVVDCAWIEHDGIILLDFKTDRVTEQTLQAAVVRYTPQVRAYAEALSRIYQKPVKQALLYFFQLNRFAAIEEI